MNHNDNFNINPYNTFPMLRNSDEIVLILLYCNYQKKFSSLTLSFISLHIEVTNTGIWRNVLVKLGYQSLFIIARNIHMFKNNFHSSLGGTPVCFLLSPWNGCRKAGFMRMAKLMNICFCFTSVKREMKQNHWDDTFNKCFFFYFTTGIWKQAGNNRWHNE